jgi:hypothetical protein
MDTDEKKAELFQNGLSIQLQDRLVLFPNLSYNALASVAIDQEGIMSAPSGGGFGGAPQKYHLVYMPLAGQLRRPVQQQQWGHRLQHQKQY